MSFYQYREGDIALRDRVPESARISGTDRLAFLPFDTIRGSSLEEAILAARRPVDIHHNEVINFHGQSGVWANKHESENWRGEIPLSAYPVNEDPNPEVIRKKADQVLVYEQEVAVRYLRPPTPPPPGEIVVREDKPIITPPAPPLVIRQQPPRPETPPPLVIREAPPPAPRVPPPKVVVVPGKKLPPPPRKVVIERLPQLPVKPQSIIVERWLPYKDQKRRVVYQPNPDPLPVIPKPKNVVIQWDQPEVVVKKELKDLGVLRANPAEYVSRFGEALKHPQELPQFVKEVPNPKGIVLAAEHRPIPVHELEGDIGALNLIDLDREGLAEYKPQVGGAPPPIPREEIPRYLEDRHWDYPFHDGRYFDHPYHDRRYFNPSGSNLVEPSVAVYRSTPSGSRKISRQPSGDNVMKYWQDNYWNQKWSDGGRWDGKWDPYFDNTLVNTYLGDAFSGFDRDGDFKLNRAEATDLFSNVNRKLNAGYSEADIQKFIDQFDHSKDGVLDFQEFKRGVLKRFFYHDHPLVSSNVSKFASYADVNYERPKSRQEQQQQQQQQQQ